VEKSKFGSNGVLTFAGSANLVEFVEATCGQGVEQNALDTPDRCAKNLFESVSLRRE